MLDSLERHWALAIGTRADGQGRIGERKAALEAEEHSDETFPSECAKSLKGRYQAIAKGVNPIAASQQ